MAHREIAFRKEIDSMNIGGKLEVDSRTNSGVRQAMRRDTVIEIIGYFPHNSIGRQCNVWRSLHVR